MSRWEMNTVHIWVRVGIVNEWKYVHDRLWIIGSLSVSTGGKISNELPACRAIEFLLLNSDFCTNSRFCFHTSYSDKILQWVYEYPLIQAKIKYTVWMCVSLMVQTDCSHLVALLWKIIQCLLCIVTILWSVSHKYSIFSTHSHSFTHIIQLIHSLTFAAFNFTTKVKFNIISSMWWKCTQLNEHTML